MVAFLLPKARALLAARPHPMHGLGSKIPHAPRKSAFWPNLPGQPSSGSVPARAPSRPLFAGPPLPHASIYHAHQPVRFLSGLRRQQRRCQRRPGRTRQVPGARLAVVGSRQRVQAPARHQPAAPGMDRPAGRRQPVRPQRGGRGLRRRHPHRSPGQGRFGHHAGRGSGRQVASGGPTARPGKRRPGQV